MNHAPENEDHSPDFGLVRWIIEFRGRRQQWQPPQFPDNEIVAGPFPFNVSIVGAGYVPTFPNLKAVVISASGEPQSFPGGYIELPSGKYKIYYVDCRERYAILPEVKGNTLDGATVALTCGITYKVNDALLIQGVRNPLDALYKGCEAALRCVIRTHNHDEIIGEPGDPHVLPNNKISEDVQLQVTTSQACRAFDLLNVNTINRQGDARLLSIREEIAVQERVGRKELEQTKIKTKIADERRDLFVKQGALVEQQAINEKNRREILYVAEKLTVELEQMRKLPQYKHEEALKAIEARSEALKSLIQAQAMPGFPRNADDLHLVDKIISELPPASPEQPPLSPPGEVSELNATLVQLLIPKKKG